MSTKKVFSLFVLTLCGFVCSFSTNSIDLFNETLEPIPVKRQTIQISNYNVTFSLPLGFTRVKSKYIVSKNIPSDTYIGAECIFEDKNKFESYFIVFINDYRETKYGIDSVMNQSVGNLMPLSGYKDKAYWYNCGYLNGNPFVLVSDIASFSTFMYGIYIKDLLSVSFCFDLYLKDGICFTFVYESICSRYNFQYEKIMEIFRSIEIKEIGEQKEK